MPNRVHSTRHLVILNYIIEFKIQNNGLPPTVREMAETFNTSTSVIQYLLSRLADMGAIEFYGNRKSRSIMIPGSECRMIPEVKEINEKEKRS